MLLVSDLDDDSGDVDRVSQAAIAYRRAGIPLHVVGLNAAPEDVAFIRRFVTGKGSFEQAALPSERASGSSGSVDLGARRAGGARGPRPRRLPAPRRASALEGIVSVWRIVLGVGALVLGVVALALAHDIRAWQGACRPWRRALRDAARDRALGGGHVAPAAIPRSALLSLRDDLAVRSGEKAFAVAMAAPTGIRRRPPEGAAPRARRARALRRARDGIARTGVAGRQPARHPRRHGRERVGCGVSDRRAAETFEAAIRADPANESAKYNLELILRRIKVVGSREGAGGSSGDFGQSLPGAGAGLPGSGY